METANSLGTGSALRVYPSLERFNSYTSGGFIYRWLGKTLCFSLIADRTDRMVYAEACQMTNRKEVAFWQLCANDDGQDIAEYAVMLAVILVLEMQSFAFR